MEERQRETWTKNRYLAPSPVQQLPLRMEALSTHDGGHLTPDGHGDHGFSYSLSPLVLVL